KQDLTSSVLGVIEAVLASVACSNYSVFFLTDGTTSASTVYNLQGHLQVPRGIGVFEVASDGQDNVTIKIQFAHVMSVIHQLRELSSHTIIVVISNDPAFLAAFNEWFLKTRLLVWSTRLLVVTRLPLPKLHHLQRTFSKMNAMLVISSDNDLGNISPREAQALRVASWTPTSGIILASNLPLFPDKFTKFPHRPTLLAASEGNPFNKIIAIEASEAPGKKSINFKGPVPNLMDYLAKALNFS
ncbi:uncharacterized protein LOC121873406, partial [Homarus americanus]